MEVLVTALTVEDTAMNYHVFIMLVPITLNVNLHAVNLKDVLLSIFMSMETVICDMNQKVL